MWTLWLKSLQGLWWQFEEFFVIITAETSVPLETRGSIPPPKARLSINHRRRGQGTQRAAGYWFEQLQHFQVLCSVIPWPRMPCAPIPHSNFLPEDSDTCTHTPLNTSSQLNHQGKASALALRTLQWHQPAADLRLQKQKLWEDSIIKHNKAKAKCSHRLIIPR